MNSVARSSLPLVLMVAISALGLGLWFGLDHHKSDNVAETAIDLSQFLQQSYPDTTGQDIAVNSVMGELTLINFWATWCAPCRHEMPVFETVYQQHQAQGFSVIGLTIDDPEPAEIFLQSTGVTYPALIVGDAGWELLIDFGNQRGLLPYSVLVDKHGMVLEKKLGEIDANLLEKWLQKYLK